VGAFGSVWETVGGVVERFDSVVWSSYYGGVLNSQGDIFKGK